MLSCRALLTAIGILTWCGCTKAPELPPSSAFLKDFRLMDRESQPLPSEWTISQSRPLDPTLQFEAVEPPAVLEGRKVLPADRWILIVDVRDESDETCCAELFRGENSFGEESIGASGPLVWESPDVPKTLPKTASWHWCHTRIPAAGRYSLVFKLYPTAYQLANSPNYDYGPGIELARQTLIVQPGQKPAGTLRLTVKKGDVLNRAASRKMRSKLK